MLKCELVSLAVFSSAPKIPLAVVDVVSLIAVFMPVFILVSFRMVSGLSCVVCFICGHDRRPPMGGSTPSNMMSGGASPSTTALAAVSAALLYSMSVCDFTLHMCVFSCLISLVLKT